jgi:hypothetical protein
VAIQSFDFYILDIVIFVGKCIYVTRFLQLDDKKCIHLFIIGIGKKKEGNIVNIYSKRIILTKLERFTRTICGYLNEYDSKLLYLIAFFPKLIFCSVNRTCIYTLIKSDIRTLTTMYSRNITMSIHASTNS